jgi:hypothetical protein
MTQVVLTSGTSWTALASTLTLVECWGGGGLGPPTGGGGGGGAYANVTNVTVTNGSSIPIVIGAHNANTNFNSGVCIANSGVIGATTAGSSTKCFPTANAHSGGTGGSGTTDGSGGCAGPDGVGLTTSSSSGGAGDNGLGGAGGGAGAVGASNVLGGGGAGFGATTGGVPGGGAQVNKTGGGGQIRITYSGTITTTPVYIYSIFLQNLTAMKSSINKTTIRNLIKRKLRKKYGY